MYAIVDIETTGGRPQGDRITEIAIVLYDGEKVIDSFSSLVNPERAIPWQITQLTGIDNDMVKNAPKFFEVAKRVVEITEGAIFVAHNVRFDYGFIQHAFRKLGYTYSRKQLCTVRLTRKVFPGLKSYSLGNLCKHFDIENLTAHRAMSDVRATLDLLKLLIPSDKEDKLSLRLKTEIAANRIPPNLNPQVLDDLPEETGVYYFHDAEGKLLYIGKSLNIRKRVLSHFSSAHKTQRGLRMVGQLADISYELTGSELIALLMENEEIKKHLPSFNRAQRRQNLKIGVYIQTDSKGYTRLEIRKLDPKNWPPAAFSDRGRADAALRKNAEEFGLCLHLCGLAHCRGNSCFYQQLNMCDGAGIGKESVENYNLKVEKILEYLCYGTANFYVIGKGRNEDEQSVVWVQDGQYRGYGFFESEDAVSEEDLKEILVQAIMPRVESPGVRQIIKQYIKKHPMEVTGKLDAEF